MFLTLRLGSVKLQDILITNLVAVIYKICISSLVIGIIRLIIAILLFLTLTNLMILMTLIVRVLVNQQEEHGNQKRHTIL
ncbi:MAG: hypothetical protein A2X67_08595 [Ignavibacteria bacterium GWA2_55_11]|nr:MAG: hypothetical protein A2X67_08595 [Ignavibacteria bacterium GWA2_55_11]